MFEYWTHALAYVPTRDMRFYLADMKRHRQGAEPWFRSVTKADLRKVLPLIRKDGALTIRDIDDDVLVEKDHAWASRKPSRTRAAAGVLQRHADRQRATRAC